MYKTFGNVATRRVLQLYAFGAVAIGLLVITIGPLFAGPEIEGRAYTNAVLFRVFGGIIIAVGFGAGVFSRIEEPILRARVVGWLAVAHLLMWLVVLSQRNSAIGAGLGRAAEYSLVVMGVVLLYVWGTAEDDAVDGTSTAQLRSKYEQQIRAAAAQEERSRLARELHDSIKQQLFVIQTAAATAQTRLPVDASGTQEALNHIREATREATTEMEAMLDSLRAAPLENAGLVDAIKKQCEALKFRSGAQVDFELGQLPPNEAVAPGTHQAVLRIAQEALSNTARHARARHVKVRLGGNRGDQLQLRIEDDGQGFDQNGTSTGMGLANMRARAQELGGSLEVTSAASGGTVVLFNGPGGKSPQQLQRAAILRAVMWGCLLFGIVPRISGEAPGLFVVALAAITIAGVLREVFALIKVRRRLHAS